MEVTIDELRKRYREMPIDKLALIEKSYVEDDFTPETRKAIKDVLEERKQELVEYRKQQAIDEQLDDKIIEEDSSKGFISRKVTCKKCGSQGVVEVHDTQHYPKEKIFKLLGKDDEGYIHLKCPSCKTDNSYSPYEFLGSKSKNGNGRGSALIVGAIYVIAALFIVFKFGGWWTYIVGGILLMMGLVSIKTGLFASETEKELTEPGDISGCIEGDCINGKGTYIHRDGGKYIGEFKNGEFKGRGILTHASVGEYTGQFKNGLPTGQGTLISPDGSKYVGELKDGSPLNDLAELYRDQDR